MRSGGDRLKVFLDFVSQPLVWLTIVVAVLLHLIDAGVLDLVLLQQVLSLIAEVFAAVNPLGGG